MRARSWPATSTLPVVASSSWTSSLISVLLPAPEGPTRNTKSPSGTTRSTSSSGVLAVGIDLGHLVHPDRDTGRRLGRGWICVSGPDIGGSHGVAGEAGGLEHGRSEWLGPQQHVRRARRPGGRCVAHRAEPSTGSAPLRPRASARRSGPTTRLEAADDGDLGRRGRRGVEDVVQPASDERLRERGRHDVGAHAQHLAVVGEHRIAPGNTGRGRRRPGRRAPCWR